MKKSLDAKERSMSREAVFKPYLLTRDNSNLQIVFRHHGLSDRIGFVYANVPYKEAVSDFITRLHKTRDELRGSSANLVTIIMDGENAWEYYPNDGYDFLHELYQRLSEDDTLRMVTVSEYLDKFPAEENLPQLHAGSWIDANFKIWIGHSEDNTSWEYLRKVREDLVDFQSARKDEKYEEAIRQAWEEIYIAEGSDWNWWYGPEHDSAQEEEFDDLYRLHLKNVYRLIGKEPPGFLFIPIMPMKSAPTGEPMGFIFPVLDGRDTSYYEWRAAGYLDIAESGGTMHRAESRVKRIYFGFNLENLYLRIDVRENEGFDDLSFSFLFVLPADINVELSLSPDAKTIEAVILRKEKDACSAIKKISAIAVDKVIELGLDFATLGVKGGDEIKLYLLVKKDSVELERWPRSAPLAIEVPTENYELMRWYV